MCQTPTSCTKALTRFALINHFEEQLLSKQEWLARKKKKERKGKKNTQ